MSLIKPSRFSRFALCGCRQQTKDINLYTSTEDWAVGTFLDTKYFSPGRVPPVRQIGDEILRRRIQPVRLRSVFTQNMENLLLGMMYRMERLGSHGMSAPQIGIDQRVVGMQITRKQLANAINKYGVHGTVLRGYRYYPLRFFLNPEISKVVDHRIILNYETCDSVEGLSALIPRYRTVEITTYNREGGRIKFTVTGYLAALFQHEIDHLNGILMTDKMVSKTVRKKDWEKLVQ